MFLKRKGTKRMILELQKYLDLRAKCVVAITLFQEHQGKTYKKKYSIFEGTYPISGGGAG